jgi:DNA-binding Xre family transcriptional regulator
MIKSNLKEILKRESDMSYKQLGLELEIVPDTISRIANNKSKGVRWKVIEKICNYFDISVGELFYYENN